MKQKVITRTLSFVLMLLALSIQANAQTATDEGAINCLLVTEQGGTETAFFLKEQPVIKLADGNLAVTTATSTLTVSLGEVQSYKFTHKDEVPSAINQAISKAVKVGMTVRSGVALFTGLKANARVSVYTVDGKQLTSVTADGNGQATIDLNALGNGKVYILRTPNAGYKISNK